MALCKLDYSTVWFTHRLNLVTNNAAPPPLPRLKLLVVVVVFPIQWLNGRRRRSCCFAVSIPSVFLAIGARSAELWCGREGNSMLRNFQGIKSWPNSFTLCGSCCSTSPNPMHYGYALYSSGAGYGMGGWGAKILKLCNKSREENNFNLIWK